MQISKMPLPKFWEKNNREKRHMMWQNGEKNKLIKYFDKIS